MSVKGGQLCFYHSFSSIHLLPSWDAMIVQNLGVGKPGSLCGFVGGGLGFQGQRSCHPAQLSLAEVGAEGVCMPVPQHLCVLYAPFRRVLATRMMTYLFGCGGLVLSGRLCPAF